MTNIECNNDYEIFMKVAEVSGADQLVTDGKNNGFGNNKNNRKKALWEMRETLF